MNNIEIKTNGFLRKANIGEPFDNVTDLETKVLTSVSGKSNAIYRLDESEQ
jgi:hypothetical protein